MAYDVVRLRTALGEVGDWSQASTFAGTRVHHGYRRAVVFDRRPLATPFDWLLADFAPVRWAQVARLDPGGFILPHRDAGPYWERWHVPIVTAGVFLQVTPVTPVDGVPFLVTQWEPHSAWNPSDRPRVHLIIDRAVEAAPSASFEAFPAPPEFAYLIPEEG